MAYSLEQLLGYETLSGLIKAVKAGVPDDILPPAFLNVSRQVIGDQTTYTVVRGSRKLARMVQYGSPARRRGLEGIGDKPVKLTHSFEEIELDPRTLQLLRGYTSYENNMGRDELARQVAQFAIKYMNTRIAMVFMMLFKGHIYWDNDGNLLPSSSGAFYDVDYGIGANNLNQLNGIIGASWATASTNIPGDIRQVKARSRQLTGYRIENAFYGENIPSYIAVNDYVKDWFTRNPAANQYWVENQEIPPGFLGIKNWWPAYEFFYEDNDDTTQTGVVGADAIVFAPAITPDVYELIEGSFDVPTSLGAFESADAAFSSLRRVNGMGGYARVIDNPVNVILRLFDTRLPVWKVPDALFIADVTP